MDAPTDWTEAELMQLASSGDRSATAQLRDHCAFSHYAGITSFEALCAAEAFGRLAAAHGHADDNLMLAGILRFRAWHIAALGDAERAVVLVAQSEALCDKFSSAPLSGGVEYLAGVLMAHADAGDELAADRLNKLCAALRPADANDLRCRLNDVCRELRREEEAAHG